MKFKANRNLFMNLITPHNYEIIQEDEEEEYRKLNEENLKLVEKNFQK